MKVVVEGKEYVVPEWMFEKAEEFKQREPEMYPVHALDAILVFNYDRVIDSDEVVKFRYDNNLENDYVATVMAMAVVSHVYGITYEA